MDLSSHDGAAAVVRQSRMSDTEYARSRHSVWIGAAGVFTDELGSVLLVKPTYRPQWLLPGGVVEAGESPEDAFRREVREELGIAREPERLLAVHWLAPGHRDETPGTPFPGEVRYIFDGGALTEQEITSLRLPADELSAHEFLGSQTAAERMTPVDGRIVQAALHARVSGTTAHLTNGRHVGPVPPLDLHQVHTRPRPGRLWPWHTGPVPDGLRQQQAWGWLFVPDGRVVIVCDPSNSLALLPGGTIETTDASPEATLVREAVEEAQLTLADVEYLGWSYDANREGFGGIGECARLRFAARVTSIGPATLDPATGLNFARLLATPHQAANLLGWGKRGHQQAEQAARLAHTRWGIPLAAPRPIAEVPAEGGMEMWS